MVLFSEQIGASLNDDTCNAGTHWNNGNDTIHGDQSSVEVRGFFRFQSTITDGSTIDDAKITLVGYETRADDFTGNIHVTDEDNAADFTNNPYARSVMGSPVSWTYPDITAGNSYDTPEIKTIVQAWIDRVGYSVNNYIAFRFDKGDAGKDELHKFYQWDGDSSKAATLVVNYTVAGISVPVAMHHYGHIIGKIIRG